VIMGEIREMNNLCNLMGTGYLILIAMFLTGFGVEAKAGVTSVEEPLIEMSKDGIILPDDVKCNGKYFTDGIEIEVEAHFLIEK
jgi:hypothetical protein